MCLHTWVTQLKVLLPVERAIMIVSVTRSFLALFAHSMQHSPSHNIKSRHPCYYLTWPLLPH